MMTEAGTWAGRRRASLALVLVLVPAEDAGELELTPMSIMYFLQSTCMSQESRNPTVRVPVDGREHRTGFLLGIGRKAEFLPRNQAELAS